MPAHSPRQAGIGLQNVRERLRMLYREAAQMNIHPGEHGRGTCVTLLIPKHDH
jgi:sensor histidine kinase YesM